MYKLLLLGTLLHVAVLTRAQVGGVIGVNQFQTASSGADQPTELQLKQQELLKTMPGFQVTPTGQFIKLEMFQGTKFLIQRTPADLLPHRGSQAIKSLESELERCRIMLTYDVNRRLFSPDQRDALPDLIRNVAAANKHVTTEVYEEEAKFYLAEDLRRQQVTVAPGPAPGPK